MYGRQIIGSTHPTGVGDGNGVAHQIAADGRAVEANSGWMRATLY
jgi:hypothetical protein